jgi:thioredoxin 1
MADNVSEFNDDNFAAEVLESDKPVLVDFWAEWCPPCKMLTPHIEQLAAEHGDRVKIGKLDVDSNQTTAQRYGVRSIPTVLLFKNGEITETIVGLKPNDIKAAVESA